MTARMPSFLRGLIVLLLVACPSLVHAATLNVPSTAYPTIQSGVDAAANGDTVLVADGTYAGDGNRDIDFHGKNITVTSQNGPTKTIIDCGGSGSSSHRGFYIHSGETAATISGFTVKNGYETGRNAEGGGMDVRIRGGVFTLDNCLITGNTVASGGTADAISADGGGIRNIANGNGTIILNDCIVTGNTASSGGTANNIFSNGGGIENTNNGGGAIALNNCTVTGNTAVASPDSSGDTNASAGGGIHNVNFSANSSIILSNCTVAENIADTDGGVSNTNLGQSNNITLTNCSIEGNTAQTGGGIGNFNNSNASETITLINCAITGNKASYGGGLANFNEQGGMTAITNCAISANTAVKSDTGDGGIGGGVYNDNSYDSAYYSSGGTTTLTNCTTAHNFASQGGGIYNDNYYANGSAFGMTNCIVYGDTGGENYNAAGNAPLVSFCDIQGGYTGTGNIDKDPLFVNTASGDLHLQSASPCVGKGTASGAPALDKDGRTRPNPPSMGAYELTQTYTVPTQFPTIQAGITAAKSGDTLMVASGTYTGPGNVDYDFDGKDVTVKSMNGPAATIIDCGGYPSSDGSGNHRAFYIHSGETSAVIDGFTIRNGYTAPIPGVPDSGFGGGICIDGASATVLRCILTGNTATFGGGVAILGTKHHSVTITNGVFTQNTAKTGGGVYNADDGGTVTLTSGKISGNTAASGGGIYTVSSGGADDYIGCGVADNTATTGGGGFYDETDTDDSTITITNCSVSGNASPLGSDMDNEDYAGSTITLLNDIFYSSTTNEIFTRSGPTPVASYSDIKGGYPGTGNIDKDPQFVNAAIGDLHLKPGSPCLGAGTSTGAPPTDLDGNPRPNPPSMGAYELAAPPATISAFTLTPAQINTPGPTVTADVTARGSFSKVTVSPAPGSLGSASPTFTLVNSGLEWKATLPTAYLKLAKTNPVTFIATGTRLDGTTASVTATLRIGALPSLTLSVSSDKSTVPAGLTFSVKGVIRNLTTTPASATVTIPVPSQLIFVPSAGFTYDAAHNTITWTGPLAASTGSYAFSAEFQASQYATANTSITINATASAPNFQSVTQPAYIVIDAPPVPLGIDIDTSGAAGQADGTAIITSTVGIAPLQAIISPVSGLEHAWLGVDHAFNASGGPLLPTKDLSPGSLAAALGVAGPGLPPTYDASFPRIGSQCNIGLRLTPTAAALNVQSIALTLLGGLLGPDADSPTEVIDFYEEFDKLDAFKDASNELMHPATTPWGQAFQVAYIAHDFLTMNPHDIDTIATFLSTKTGKTIAGQAVKDALGVVGTGRAILEIGQIVADEAIFTGFTGGADAEITFTGSAFKHPEELNSVSSHHLNGNTQHH